MESMFEKMFGYGGVKGAAEDAKKEIKKALPKKKTVMKAKQGIGSAIKSGISSVRRYADEYNESQGREGGYHPFQMGNPSMFGIPTPKRPVQRTPPPRKQRKSRPPQHHMHPVKKEPEKESEERRRARERKRYDELVKKGMAPSSALMQIEGERK